jgi:hypothetical protein
MKERDKHLDSFRRTETVLKWASVTSGELNTATTETSTPMKTPTHSKRRNKRKEWMFEKEEGSGVLFLRLKIYVHHSLPFSLSASALR